MNALLYIRFPQEIIFLPGILRTVDPEAFCGLKNLKSLNVNINHLSGIPAIESIKPTLQSLSLDDNFISDIASDYFRGFVQLRAVRLGHNNLTYLPDFFWLESSIRTIHIAGNRIQSLDAILAHGFYKALRYVDASDNMIPYLNISHLRNCPKLMGLLITGNRLTSIGDYRIYHSSAKVVMHSNPWHCDSELAWITGLLSSSLICHSPECFAGMFVRNISKNW